MNTNTLRGIKPEALTELSVVEYLQGAPDFFERNRALLDKLRLPHARGEGATVSLVERQVEVLRERNQATERKLKELIEVARINDQLAERIHRLNLRMLRAQTPAAAIDAVETSLREDFEAKHSVLVLFTEPSPELEQSAGRFLRISSRDAAEMKMFESLLTSGKPRCGQIRDSQRDYLFGKDTVEIGSAALTPLGPKGALGILAIGSSDTQRFHPGMSTEFLSRVGELVSCALAR